MNRNTRDKCRTLIYRYKSFVAGSVLLYSPMPCFKLVLFHKNVQKNVFDCQIKCISYVEEILLYLCQLYSRVKLSTCMNTYFNKVSQVEFLRHTLSFTCFCVFLYLNFGGFILMDKTSDLLKYLFVMSNSRSHDDTYMKRIDAARRQILLRSGEFEQQFSLGLTNTSLQVHSRGYFSEFQGPEGAIIV